MFVENGRLFKVTSSHVGYTVKVAASQKWCKVDTLLLHTSNRKCHMAYRFVPFPMTLNDLEGYSPKRLFKCNSQTFVQHFPRFQLSALRAPSANADLLNCCACRTWLSGPPLAALLYIMHFATTGFMDDVIFSHNRSHAGMSNSCNYSDDFASSSAG